MIFYWVDTGFACGGVEVRNGKIVDAPPIFRSWIGRDWHNFIWKYKPKVKVCDV